MSKPKPPKWLKDSSAAPCSPWCLASHETDDHPGDRTHYSRWEFAFRPALMDPFIYRPRDDGSGLFDHGSWELKVYLEQGWRDREPYVTVGPDVTTGPLGEGMQLTIDEAVKLRAALGKAIKLARGGER